MHPTNTIHLALADDEALFVQGLQYLLSGEEGLEVVLTASDGTDLLQQFETAETLPDLVLLDLRMKPLDGLETARVLHKQYPEVRVIILSTYYRDTYLNYMMRLGVSAFLPKNTDPETLVQAIRKVFEKGLYFTEDQVNDLHRQWTSGQRPVAPHWDGSADLTKREREVLHLICDQHTSAEIAEKLFVSVRTVEGHRNNLLLKTGARNTVGLVWYALLHESINMPEKLMDFTLDR